MTITNLYVLVGRNILAADAGDHPVERVKIAATLHRLVGEHPNRMFTDDPHFVSDFWETRWRIMLGSEERR